MARRALLALAVILAKGCGESVPSPAVANVALVLPDGARVSAIGYAVGAPDGRIVLSGTKDDADRDTPVDLNLSLPPTRGYVDQCPVMQAWSAQLAAPPAPAGTIDLTALAVDADSEDAISYAWSAPTGSFSTPSSRSTVYTCASNEPVLVTLTIADDHQPSGCTTRAQLPVGCGAAPP